MIFLNSIHDPIPNFPIDCGKKNRSMVIKLLGDPLHSQFLSQTSPLNNILIPQLDIQDFLPTFCSESFVYKQEITDALVFLTIGQFFQYPLNTAERISTQPLLAFAVFTSIILSMKRNLQVFESNQVYAISMDKESDVCLVELFFLAATSCVPTQLTPTLFY